MFRCWDETGYRLLPIKTCERPASANGGGRKPEVMQMSAKHNRRGFTLVEILIVVVILGILAAMVIPKFANASGEAKRNSLSSSLQALRGQIELYMLQHGDAAPALTTTDWTPLTQQ